MDVALDGRSDVFSLGIVLWECLTGARLFPGRSDLELLTQTLQRPIRPPSALNAEVSGALDAVVVRALERERDRRYPSALALAEALGELPEAGRSADLATQMRQLYPEGARDRALGLASSVALVRAETSEVRRFLGEQAPVVAQTVAQTIPEKTKVGRIAERAGEATTATADVPEPPAASAAVDSTASREPIVERETAEEVPTAPTRLIRRRRWGLAVGGSTLGVVASAGVALLVLRDGAATVPLVARPQSVLPAGAEPSVDPPPVSPPALAPAVRAGPPPPAAEPSSRPGNRQSHASAAGLLLAAKVMPWAEVFIDGRSHGYSPNRWRLPAGRHEVRLSNIAAGLQRRFTVDVPPGGTVVLSGPLKSLQPQSEE
jgi:hypothetical protein